MPQRRQKRAVADSESPQFEQGCTPETGAAGPVAWGDSTSCAEAAHSASLDAFERLARRAMLGDSCQSGWVGHWGSDEACAAGGGVTGAAGVGCAGVRTD